jgi:hypothetical protein
MDDFPPYPFLCQVSKNAHDCIPSYLWLWDTQDMQGYVILDKDILENEFIYDIHRLDELDVIDTQEINGEIVVKLKKPEIKADGYLLS